MIVGCNWFQPFLAPIAKVLLLCRSLCENCKPVAIKSFLYIFFSMVCTLGVLSHLEKISHVSGIFICLSYKIHLWSEMLHWHSLLSLFSSAWLRGLPDFLRLASGNADRVTLMVSSCVGNLAGCLSSANWSRCFRFEYSSTAIMSVQHRSVSQG